MPASSMKLVIAAATLVGAAAGLGGFTFVYARGTSYLTNDPAACANCHVMTEQYEGWMKGSHRAVATCNDCHTPHAFIPKYASKAENGIWHSKGFTFQDFHEPIRIRPHNARVLQHNCIDCHADFVHDILGESGHDAHEWSCVHCHQNVGHGPTR